MQSPRTKIEGTKTMDITPDPRILMALTYTPLSALDALSELIDNSIDALKLAELRGDAVDFPLIAIEIPGKAEIGRGEGRIRVLDNGPGMSPDETRTAITAGYSSNNPFDSLGLFGMGFNIASGKLGRATRLLTARKQDDTALQVVIDLPEMQQNRSYEIQRPRSPSRRGSFTVRTSRLRSGGRRGTRTAGSLTSGSFRASRRFGADLVRRSQPPA